MGAAGVWDLAIRYGDFLAAVAPIAGRFGRSRLEPETNPLSRRVEVCMARAFLVHELASAASQGHPAPGGLLRSGQRCALSSSRVQPFKVSQRLLHLPMRAYQTDTDRPLAPFQSLWVGACLTGDWCAHWELLVC